MSNLSLSQSPERALYSIDLNIPPQLHQEPVLANLIRDYDLIVNFKSAVLDRKATGGGWFTLSLEGHPQTIERALSYLQNLGVKIFSRGSVAIELPVIDVDREDHLSDSHIDDNTAIDRLVTGYDL